MTSLISQPRHIFWWLSVHREINCHLKHSSAGGGYFWPYLRSSISLVERRPKIFSLVLRDTIVYHLNLRTITSFRGWNSSRSGMIMQYTRRSNLDITQANKRGGITDFLPSLHNSPFTRRRAGAGISVQNYHIGQFSRSTSASPAKIRLWGTKTPEVLLGRHPPDPSVSFLVHGVHGNANCNIKTRVRRSGRN
jgi:hypothetical protein